MAVVAMKNCPQAGCGSQDPSQQLLTLLCLLGLNFPGKLR